MNSVTPIDKMIGDDSEDTELLRQSQAEAEAYLASYDWFKRIAESYYGRGVGGLIAVFLFRVEISPDFDEWLWVIVGDVPSAYIVTDDAPDPYTALDAYIALMSDWVTAARTGKELSAVFPVSAEPTRENANLLSDRLAFLRSEILPSFR